MKNTFEKNVDFYNSISPNKMQQFWKKHGTTDSMRSSVQKQKQNEYQMNSNQNQYQQRQQNANIPNKEQGYLQNNMQNSQVKQNHNQAQKRHGNNLNNNININSQQQQQSNFHLENSTPVNRQGVHKGTQQQQNQKMMEKKSTSQQHSDSKKIYMSMTGGFKQVLQLNSNNIANNLSSNNNNININNNNNRQNIMNNFQQRIQDNNSNIGISQQQQQQQQNMQKVNREFSANAKFVKPSEKKQVQQPQQQAQQKKMMGIQPKTFSSGFGLASQKLDKQGPFQTTKNNSKMNQKLKQQGKINNYFDTNTKKKNNSNSNLLKSYNKSGIQQNNSKQQSNHNNNNNNDDDSINNDIEGSNNIINDDKHSNKPKSQSYLNDQNVEVEFSNTLSDFRKINQRNFQNPENFSNIQSQLQQTIQQQKLGQNFFHQRLNSKDTSSQNNKINFNNNKPNTQELQSSLILNQQQIFMQSEHTPQTNHYENSNNSNKNNNNNQNLLQKFVSKVQKHEIISKNFKNQINSNSCTTKNNNQQKSTNPSSQKNLGYKTEHAKKPQKKGSEKSLQSNARRTSQNLTISQQNNISNQLSNNGNSSTLKKKKSFMNQQQPQTNQQQKLLQQSQKLQGSQKMLNSQKLSNTHTHKLQQQQNTQQKLSQKSLNSQKVRSPQTNHKTHSSNQKQQQNYSMKQRKIQQKEIQDMQNSLENNLTSLSQSQEMYHNNKYNDHVQNNSIHNLDYDLNKGSHSSKYSNKIQHSNENFYNVKHSNYSQQSPQQIYNNSAINNNNIDQQSAGSPQNNAFSKTFTQNTMNINININQSNLQQQLQNQHQILQQQNQQQQEEQKNNNVNDQVLISQQKQQQAQTAKQSFLIQNQENFNYIRHKFGYYNTNMEMHGRYPNQDYFNQVYREHFLQNFHAVQFCKTLNKVDEKVLEEKRVMLPDLTDMKQKTIVFDLDETLIHCNENSDVESDVILAITFPYGEIVDAGINIRPFAIECLQELSKDFEIIIFTASHECYASKVIDHLDPENKYISHRLYRENCIETDEGVHIKDLRVLGNRDINNIVLIDNAAYSYGYQFENGIPIIPYYENKNDQELRFIIDFIKAMLKFDDVRPVLAEYFQMNIYAGCESPKEAFKKIYGIDVDCFDDENNSNNENDSNEGDQNSNSISVSQNNQQQQQESLSQFQEQGEVQDNQQQQ